MKENILLRTVTRMFLIPQIILFGFYVIAHGESGPGGGFQGGVIIAAGFILYSIIFGIEETRKICPEWVTDILCPLGVMIYACIGAWCIMSGGNFLEYGVLPFGDKHFAVEMGILGIEVGVGITVASVMMTIFFELAVSEDD